MRVALAAAGGDRCRRRRCRPRPSCPGAASRRCGRAVVVDDVRAAVVESMPLTMIEPKPVIGPRIGAGAADADAAAAAGDAARHRRRQPRRGAARRAKGCGLQAASCRFLGAAWRAGGAARRAGQAPDRCTGRRARARRRGRWRSSSIIFSSAGTSSSQQACHCGADQRAQRRTESSDRPSAKIACSKCAGRRAEHVGHRRLQVVADVGAQVAEHARRVAARHEGLLAQRHGVALASSSARPGAATPRAGARVHVARDLLGQRLEARRRADARQRPRPARRACGSVGRRASARTPRGRRARAAARRSAAPRLRRVTSRRCRPVAALMRLTRRCSGRSGCAAWAADDEGRAQHLVDSGIGHPARHRQPCQRHQQPRAAPRAAPAARRRRVAAGSVIGQWSVYAGPDGADRRARPVRMAPRFTAEPSSRTRSITAISTRAVGRHTPLTSSVSPSARSARRRLFHSMTPL